MNKNYIDAVILPLTGKVSLELTSKFLNELQEQLFDFILNYESKYPVKLLLLLQFYPKMLGVNEVYLLNNLKEILCIFDISDQEVMMYADWLTPEDDEEIIITNIEENVLLDQFLSLHSNDIDSLENPTTLNLFEFMLSNILFSMSNNHFCKNQKEYIEMLHPDTNEVISLKNFKKFLDSDGHLNKIYLDFLKTIYYFEYSSKNIKQDSLEKKSEIESSMRENSSRWKIHSAFINYLDNLMDKCDVKKYLNPCVSRHVSSLHINLGLCRTKNCKNPNCYTYWHYQHNLYKTETPAVSGLENITKFPNRTIKPRVLPLDLTLEVYDRLNSHITTFNKTLKFYKPCWHVYQEFDYENRILKIRCDLKEEEDYHNVGKNEELTPPEFEEKIEEPKKYKVCKMKYSSEHFPSFEEIKGQNLQPKEVISSSSVSSTKDENSKKPQSSRTIKDYTYYQRYLHPYFGKKGMSNQKCTGCKIFLAIKGNPQVDNELRCETEVVWELKTKKKWESISTGIGILVSEDMQGKYIRANQGGFLSRSMKVVEKDEEIAKVDDKCNFVCQDAPFNCYELHCRNFVDNLKKIATKQYDAMQSCNSRICRNRECALLSSSIKRYDRMY